MAGVGVEAEGVVPATMKEALATATGTPGMVTGGLVSAMVTTRGVEEGGGVATKEEVT